MKKLSLEMKARQANGKDRTCGKCNHFPCSEAMKKVCDEAFIRGYKKGFKKANEEQQERIDSILHPVTDACGDNEIYVFMRDVRSGRNQPFIGDVRVLDVESDFDISTLDFQPEHKGDPKRLQIAWCYPKDLIELLGYDKKFSQFERIALNERRASYPEKQYRENLAANVVEREQYEKLYDYDKRRV